MENISQAQLIEMLSAIFPAFAEEWDADAASTCFPTESLHSVYQAFLSWVGAARPSGKELKALAFVLSAEVAAGGDRENAVATCFLEHCGQVTLARQLSPLLSAAARSRLHA